MAGETTTENQFTQHVNTQPYFVSLIGMFWGYTPLKPCLTAEFPLLAFVCGPRSPALEEGMQAAMGDHWLWPWTWPWPWIFKVKYGICCISTKSGLKVRCKDLPDSDRGDFRCRHAVDSSSSLCSCHRIIMKFSEVISADKSDVHAKGQRSKVKVTEVKPQLSRLWTVIPV